MRWLLLGLLLTVPALAQQPILLPVELDPPPELWQRLVLHDAVLVRQLRAQLQNLRLEVDALRFQPTISYQPPPVPVRYYQMLEEERQASANYIRRLLGHGK